VQAHTLGEVGILGTVLLRVYFGTILPIFIEIGSYLTDKEQTISWQFFGDTVYNPLFFSFYLTGPHFWSYVRLSLSPKVNLCWLSVLEH